MKKIAVIVISVFIFLLILAIDVSSTLPAPIHNWSFDAGINDTGSSPIYVTFQNKMTIINDSRCVRNGCLASSLGTINLSSEFMDLSNDFTLACLFHTNQSVDQGVFYETATGGEGFRWYHQATTNKECINIPGVASSCSGNALSPNTWALVTLMYNKTNAGDRYKIFFNTTLQTDSSNTALTDGTLTRNMISDGFQPWQINGYLDECRIFQQMLTDAQVSELYTEVTTLPAPGNNPPTIVFNFQNPSNITYSNVINDINVSYNITDTDINESTIFLEIILNNTRFFLNGTEQIMNKNSSYTSKNNASYYWTLTEDDILGGTANIAGELFDNGTLLNATLTNANQWVKMQFFNVSNDVQQQFFEIMDENISSTLDTDNYYYCNSSYVSGSVLSNNNCVLMVSVPNNYGFNHSQGNSRHRVFNMGINVSNGKIGSVYVTPESFVLRRGNNVGVRYYYLNIATRQNTTQTTNNNGVSWTSQTYTVNAHINSIRSNSSIQYRAKAKDRTGQETVSSFNTDRADTPLSPPINVIIYNPVLNGVYNNTIVINHSASFSESGGTIINYTYYYKSSPSSERIYIGFNLHPETTYNWDISNIINDEYIIEIITKDSLGLSSDTESDYFTISNPLTIDQQLLSDINTNLSLIYEVLIMLPLILLYILFMVLGYHMITNGNLVSGFILYVISLGFDFFFVGWIYSNYSDLVDSSFFGQMINIFLLFIWVWIVGKISSLIMIRVNRYKNRYSQIHGRRR